jgi:RNA polymerase sigma-70 factor (ECF subfamily)
MDHACKGDALIGGEVERWASIIERARRFDPAAYDELVDAYGPRLFGFFYRLSGSREDAEDLLQEVFLRVVRRLPEYVHKGRFEGWLFRIAANLGRDRIRRVRRAPTMRSLSGGKDEEEDPEERNAGDGSDGRENGPDQALIRREQLDRMQRALEQLPAPEREVIMLRHYSALSFAEIAEVMGTPLGTALARAHRGLAKLRRLMEING